MGVRQVDDRPGAVDREREGGTPSPRAQSLDETRGPRQSARRRLGKEAIIDNSRPRPVSPLSTSPWNSPSNSTPPSRATFPEEAVATLQEDLQQIVDQGEQAAG